jgi:hypothetical protein
MSSMKRFNARSRCLRPASTSRHWRAAMVRGMMSKGQARSMLPSSEYTVKVTPIWRMVASAMRRRDSISASLSAARQATRRRAGARARPGLLISSSNSAPLS